VAAVLRHNNPIVISQSIRIFYQKIKLFFMVTVIFKRREVGVINLFYASRFVSVLADLTSLSSTGPV
jgi:hypothetical protein